jgi:hypothetical protein
VADANGMRVRRKASIRGCFLSAMNIQDNLMTDYSSLCVGLRDTSSLAPSSSYSSRLGPSIYRDPAPFHVIYHIGPEAGCL